eukprot:gene8575-10548_t
MNQSISSSNNNNNSLEIDIDNNLNNNNTTNNNIYPYKEIVSPQDDIISNDYSSNSETPIIIDNGSYQCRAGYSTDTKPRLVFRSLVGKLKSTSSPVVGNSIKESDISKLTIRSPFDSNLLVHPPSQESILDYIFQKLGIDKSIQNPIVITEPFANPTYCRKYMNELLFECYSVPSVVYGVDSLFSYYGNRHLMDDNGRNAMIIGSGYNTTHIFNVRDYKVQHSETKRINVGGSNGTDLLRKFLHLIYPIHKSFLTQNYINEIKENHTYFSKNYLEELNIYLDGNNKRTRYIQLPFQEIDLNQLEEERQRKLLQKQEFRNKLKEMTEQKRKDKKLELEEQLQTLESILVLKNTGQLKEYQDALKSESMTEKELLKSIDELQEKITGKKKETVEKPDEEEFPLLFIQDSELSGDQLKEKKRQRQQKNLKDARLSAKKKKMLEKEKEDAAVRAEEEAWQKDPDQYVKDLLEKRRKILEKKEQRLKLKSQTQVYRRQSRLRSIEKKESDEIDPVEEEENQILAGYEKLLNKFEPGWSTQESEPTDAANNPIKDYYTAQDYQIRLGVERIRIPEILFQPKSIIGVDQMGLMETINSVLSQIPPNLRDLVSGNVFITGGNSKTLGFKERLEYELRQIRKVGAGLNIVSGSDGSLDAWYGAKKWTIDHYDPQQWGKVSISNQDYLEKVDVSVDDVPVDVPVDVSVDVSVVDDVPVDVSVVGDAPVDVSVVDDVPVDVSVVEVDVSSLPLEVTVEPSTSPSSFGFFSR